MFFAQRLTTYCRIMQRQLIKMSVKIRQDPNLTPTRVFNKFTQNQMGFSKPMKVIVEVRFTMVKCSAQVYSRARVRGWMKAQHSAILLLISRISAASEGFQSILPTIEVRNQMKFWKVYSLEVQISGMEAKNFQSGCFLLQLLILPQHHTTPYTDSSLSLQFVSRICRQASNCRCQHNPRIFSKQSCKQTLRLCWKLTTESQFQGLMILLSRYGYTIVRSTLGKCLALLQMATSRSMQAGHCLYDCDWDYDRMKAGRNWDSMGLQWAGQSSRVQSMKRSCS